MDRWTKQPQRMHYAAAGGSPEEARGDRWRLTVLPRNGRGLNCMTAGPSCGSIKPGALRYRAICHVPDREYRPREPISISCSDRVCTASGIVDYRAVDPIAKILSEGVASFEYRLAPSGTALKISLENGSVLSRNRTSLSSVSSYERDGAPVSPVAERHGNGRAAWHIAR